MNERNSGRCWLKRLRRDSDLKDDEDGSRPTELVECPSKNIPCPISGTKLN